MDKTIRLALERRLPLTIIYQAESGELTKRQVVPLALEGEGDDRMLVAFCRFRGGKRSFRLSNILSAMLD